MVTTSFVPSDGEAKLHLEDFNSPADYQHTVGGYVQSVEIATLATDVRVVPAVDGEAPNVFVSGECLLIRAWLAVLERLLRSSFRLRNPMR